MKWYKHISDSLDDPFIFDLVNEFGGDGYLVFFGILEIYAREYKPEPNWNLTVTRAYLKQKLHKRQDTLVIKVLEVIKNSGKWNISFNGHHVTVYIPKFTELLDDWTNRLLRSSSEVTPEKHRTDTDTDKDKKKKDIYSQVAKKTIDYLNEIAGRKFSYGEGNLKHIRARLKEGHTEEDCRKVIDIKWADPDFDKKYFRPATLFNSEKFEGYLNERSKKRWDEG